MILNPLAPAVEQSVANSRVATWPLGKDDFDVAMRWLADERNAQWLDFGLSQRGRHCVRATPSETERTIGSGSTYWPTS